MTVAQDPATVWTVILVLGFGTFALRFSFLGLLGNRSLPEWALRLLRYTPMAVIPGLVAPAVLWPAATQGETDPARLAAALATIAAGLIFRNTLAAISAGVVVLFTTPLLIG
jgi:branched-subunit amino acid transport protein